MLQAIDNFNQKLALGVRWIMVVLMVIVVFDVLMRYFFNKPTVWAFELAMILGATSYFLSWGEVERVKMHLRVDVFYMRCSPRWRAIIDVMGTVICWYPVYVAYMFTAGKWAIRAWRVHEVMVESYWYPPAGPIRSFIVIGLTIACLQLTASLIRNIHVLKTGEPL
jgi:TRAP-type mannitol/chloroaromatic compound transport system permease small subunit